MKISNLIVLATYFFSSTLVTAASISEQSPEEDTLCYPFEEIYFSCHAAKKIVSICASGNISPKNGYVKYRFGSVGNIELEYPEASNPPLDNFHISASKNKKTRHINIKFKSGDYIYHVYENKKSGVYIVQNERTIRRLVCEDGNYSEISPRAERGIKHMSPDDTYYVH